MVRGSFDYLDTGNFAWKYLELAFLHVLIVSRYRRFILIPNMAMHEDGVAHVPTGTLCLKFALFLRWYLASKSPHWSRQF